jgi:mitochondrial FAD-linked sulfhydryl oxidase
MLLGPDGKPCRVCDSFKSFAKSKGSSASVSENKSSSDAAAATTKKEMAVECPPDKDELGRSTWTFLHTMAAYYPEEPSDADQKTV